MSLMLILFAMIIMEYPKMDCIIYSVSIIEQPICLAPERGLAPHPFLEGETEELALLFPGSALYRVV